MIDDIKNYANELFIQAPSTMQALELREEVTSNLIDKYTDLVKNGVSQEEAYRVAVASVGDVGQLIGGLTDEKVLFESDENRKKYGILTAVGVGVLIASFVPNVISEFTKLPEELAVVFMFLMWAIGVGTIVYANITRPKYRKSDDTVVENFKEWNAKKDSGTSMEKAVSSAIWLIATAIFFILMFTTGKPYIVWVIFLIAGALQAFVSVAFASNGKK